VLAEEAWVTLVVTIEAQAACNQFGPMGSKLTYYQNCKAALGTPQRKKPSGSHAVVGRFFLFDAGYSPRPPRAGRFSRSGAPSLSLTLGLDVLQSGRPRAEHVYATIQLWPCSGI